jgi:hypothetical protein
MNAIMTCVDYSAELALTLPYNRHHFDRVMVVTSLADAFNVHPVAEASGAEVHATDAFYRNGANFNKYLALEEGLDRLGRTGWLCIMDADILLPKGVAVSPPFEVGKLYGPVRRVCDPFPQEIPPEDSWSSYPILHTYKEFSGYTQIFHASDPALGVPPWHPTNLLHAGKGDWVFQSKWPEPSRIRPPFEVLHLGPINQNWFGKTEAGKAKLREYWRTLRRPVHGG